MKRLFPFLIPLLGFGAAFAASWLARPLVNAPAPALELAGGATPAAPAADAQGPGKTRDKVASYSSEELSSILETPSTLHRQTKLKNYFERLNSGQFPEALRDLIQARADDADTLTILFRCWAEIDPERAIYEGLKFPADAKRRKFLSAAARAWARRDPLAARAVLPKLEKFEQLGLQSYLRGLAGASAGTEDSAAAMSPRDRVWQHIKVSGNGHGMGGEAWTEMRKWAKEDPAAAGQEVLRSEILRRNSNFISAVYEEWLAKDPAGAEGFLAKFPQEVRDDYARNQISALIQKSPDQARDRIEKLPDGKLRAYGFASLARILFDKDREAAIALVANLPEQDRANFPDAFFEKWLQAEPERAAVAMLEHPGYLRAAEATPDREHFTRVGEMLKPWSQKDPAAAGAFAARLATKDRAEAMYAIAQVWCARDAAAANQWAASLPPGPAQDEALRQFTHTWAKNDANLVTKHLDQLPTGSGKSAAVEGFAFAVFDTDPDAVLAWTRVIHTQEMRFDVLSRSWSSWREKNYAAADDWLRNNTTLQPEEKHALETAR